MSDTTYDENDEQDQPSPDGIRSLREKAKKADRLEREFEALKRENAFIKAGIPLEDPKVTYFVKGYEGDLDPQAIRQAAVEAGFIAPPQNPQAEQQAQAQARAAALSAGSGGEFDGSDIIAGLQEAFNEGGVEGMAQFGQNYGLRITDS